MITMELRINGAILPRRLHELINEVEAWGWELRFYDDNTLDLTHPDTEESQLQVDVTLENYPEIVSRGTKSY